MFACLRSTPTPPFGADAFGVGGREDFPLLLPPADCEDGAIWDERHGFGGFGLCEKAGGTVGSCDESRRSRNFFEDGTLAPGVFGQVRFNWFEARDGIWAEAIDECVNKFAPRGMGDVFDIASECGVVDLLRTQSRGAFGAEDEAFDAAGKIDAFEFGTHERPDVFEFSAGAAEGDRDEFGRGFRTSEFDLEPAHAEFAGCELIAEIFKDQCAGGVDGFGMVGRPFEKHGGDERRRWTNRIESFGNSAERFVDAGEDVDSET